MYLFADSVTPGLQTLLHFHAKHINHFVKCCDEVRYCSQPCDITVCGTCHQQWCDLTISDINIHSDSIALVCATRIIICHIYNMAKIHYHHLYCSYRFQAYINWNFYCMCSKSEVIQYLLVKQKKYTEMYLKIDRTEFTCIFNIFRFT